MPGLLTIQANFSTARLRCIPMPSSITLSTQACAGASGLSQHSSEATVPTISRNRTRYIEILASDEEVAGSNPATPTTKWQVTGHLVTFRLLSSLPMSDFGSQTGANGVASRPDIGQQAGKQRYRGHGRKRGSLTQRFLPAGLQRSLQFLPHSRANVAVHAAHAGFVVAAPSTSGSTATRREHANQTPRSKTGATRSVTSPADPLNHRG